MGASEEIFPVVILNARPAAGKSEIIDYLKGLAGDERATRFHIGRIEEIDDFPMLWSWFEEDAILTEWGAPRLHTDEEGYFKNRDLWNLLVRRMCLDYEKKIRDTPLLHADTTVVIEFSRGSEHGGYVEAYKHLSAQVLANASVLYVDVSYDESVRKNKRRFNPGKPDSILEHGLPDEKMERLYGEIDWEEFSAPDPSHLLVGNHRVPYVVLDNSDDVTTRGGEALGDSLETAFGTLWTIRRGLHKFD